MDQDVLISRYLDWKMGKVSITPEWEKNIRNLLMQFLLVLNVPGEECRTEDIFRAFKVIRESKKYQPNYKRQMISAAKAFCKWLAKKNSSIDTVELDLVKLPAPQWKTKKPEDMLTIDEVQTVIQSARNARDKAFLATLYDGSNRPSELIRLRWKDLIQDQFGYYFITDGKTKKERRIRLTNQSIPYLDMWRAEHPDPSPGQYVFCTINATEKGVRPLTIDNIQRMLKLIKKKTGIQKLKPSIFRSTKITHDVASGMELPYIMKKNWGSLETKMIDVYTNLDAGYLDEVALRHAGMQRNTEFKEKKIYKLDPPVCPICQRVNLLGAKFCTECLHPLTKEANQLLQNSSQKLHSLLVTNPKAQEIFIQLVNELTPKGGNIAFGIGES